METNIVRYLTSKFDQPPADPTQWFLCSSPWPMVLIVTSYLLCVFKPGHRFMASRQPYDLRVVLKFYNIFQIAYNSIMFILACYYIFYLRPYNFQCLETMPLDHPLKNMDRTLAYAYYINKFIDMLDTVFFVLRKSYKQITTLHLLHHLFMPVCGYFVIRFNGYGGHLLVLGFLNVFVHIVMYSYYYLSSQDPNIKLNLWWKQNITMLQMLQLVVIFIHSMWTLMQPKCLVSRILIYLTLIMSGAMFTLFTNFYIQSYVRPKWKMSVKKLK